MEETDKEADKQTTDNTAVWHMATFKGTYLNLKDGLLKEILLEVGTPKDESWRILKSHLGEKGMAGIP